MNTKDNRRVQLTKKILKLTLMEMLMTEELRKITITSICEKADVNRSTFYKYYGSQYDLLEDAENDIINFIKTSIVDIDPQNSVVATTNILTLIKNNKAIANLLIRDSVGNDFKKRLFNIPVLTKKLRSTIGGYNDDEYVYVQDFIIDGLYSILKRWIDEDFKEDPKEIALLIQKILLNFA